MTRERHFVAIVLVFGFVCVCVCVFSGGGLNVVAATFSRPGGVRARD